MKGDALEGRSRGSTPAARLRDSVEDLEVPLHVSHELGIRRVIDRLEPHDLGLERRVLLLEISQELELRRRGPQDEHLFRIEKPARDVMKESVQVIRMVVLSRRPLRVPTDVGVWSADRRFVERVGIDVENSRFVMIDPYRGVKMGGHFRRPGAHFRPVECAAPCLESVGLPGKRGANCARGRTLFAPLAPPVDRRAFASRRVELGPQVALRRITMPHRAIHELPIRRACLVTAGGDAPGVNAIVRGFVHQAARNRLEVVGCRYGFDGLLDREGLQPLSLENVRGILPRGGSVLGCSVRTNPFCYAAKEGSQETDMTGPIIDRLRSHRIDTLALVGGDGTMAAARRFSAAGLDCIGIPKTIDNDLLGTDQTCGFDSAVETATAAIDALHTTAEAHRRIMIVETMGRYAGWIALRSGLAGGADVILIPEIPYRVERVVAKVKARESLGLRFTIIVMAEGAHAAGEGSAEIEGGHRGHLPRLGGAGERLAAELRDMHLDHEVRVTVLGHLQRGGSPSAFDRTLGTRFGVHAANLCTEGKSGEMVALRNGHMTSIPLTETGLRSVNPENELVTTARVVGIEFGA